jgi:hypothetical protein
MFGDKNKAPRNDLLLLMFVEEKAFLLSSFLLQYLASRYWNDEQSGSKLDRIILLEKASSDDMDWGHFTGTACTEMEHLSVSVEVWEQTNLHEIDQLVERFRPISHSLAFTGIHLCKLLSPALVSLVNAIGTDKCRYICLAPCCMPRAITKHCRRGPNKENPTRSSPKIQSFIRVLEYESEEKRSSRLILQGRRDAAKRRRRKFDRVVPVAATQCFHCDSKDHYLRSCPYMNDTQKREDRQALLAKNLTKEGAPCWNCGDLGHFKWECPNPSIKRRTKEEIESSYSNPSLEQPFRRLDVTHILKQRNPMQTYCQLLLSSLDGRGKDIVADWKGKILETDLVNHKASPQPDTNWNQGRKSLFIVSWTEP